MQDDITGWGFQESYCSGRKGTYSVDISQKPVVLCPSFPPPVWNTDKATMPGMIESSGGHEDNVNTHCGSSTWVPDSIFEVLSQPLDFLLSVKKKSIIWSSL